MLQIGQINDNLLFICQSGKDPDMKKVVEKDGLDKKYVQISIIPQCQ